MKNSLVKRETHKESEFGLAKLVILCFHVRVLISGGLQHNYSYYLLKDGGEWDKWTVEFKGDLLKIF